MTSLETFKEILIDNHIVVPVESLEVFRDLVDMQADIILDSWLKSKLTPQKGVELQYAKD